MGALAMLLPFAQDLLKKLFPDPAAQADAQFRLAQLMATGELAQLQSATALLQGQLDINKVEAASSSLFVAGWRPYLGWICGNVIAFKYIFGPLLAMIAEAAGITVHVPILDASELWPVLGALLGIGTMRTVEKVKGVA